MKKVSFFIAGSFYLFLIGSSTEAQIASVRDSLGGAPVPPEIEDPECIGINKEASHATQIRMIP